MISYGPPTHKQVFVLDNNGYALNNHEAGSHNLATPHSGHVGATRLRPLQRAVALFSDASNAAYWYKTNRPHTSTVHHPTMISASHRYSPYPPHKPSRRPSQSSLSTLNNIESLYEYSIFGISHSSKFPLPSTSNRWEYLPQSNWGSGSPCSEDSAISTPVSEQGQQQPFIHGEDVLSNPDYDGQFHLWQALNYQTWKPQFHSSEIQTIPSDVALTSANTAVMDSGYETLLKAISDSSKQRETPSSASSCSFATTHPFISPFSDSAVTATPQSLPLYAPRPVRPIPKVCFTPPEEDTLPTTSILFTPVSDSVKQATWPTLTVSGWTNP